MKEHPCTFRARVLLALLLGVVSSAAAQDRPLKGDPFRGRELLSEKLCTQCHSVPGHDSNVMHGTLWAGKACNDCHTDIHGSYDNRLFVNESLKSQGCFNAGCHQL